LAAQAHGPCELKTFFIRKTFKDITPVPNHKKIKEENITWLFGAVVSKLEHKGHYICKLP
jgi:hypothetical protein